MIARFRDFFHIYVNERFILEEIGEMLNGNTYINERFNEVTLMRGFQYKDKEGVEMFLGKSYVNASLTLSRVTLMRGFTVYKKMNQFILN